MENKEHRKFSEVLSELVASAKEVTSLAQSSETEIKRQVFSEFAILVDKFVPVLNYLKDHIKIMEHPPVQKAVESLGKEFISRAKAIIANPNSKTVLKEVEDMVHDLGRSLGFVLFVSLEVSTDFKDHIGTLHKDLMNAKFDMSLVVSSTPSSSRYSEIISELEEEEEIQEEKISVGIDDVVVTLKYGHDEKIRLALLLLRELVGDKKVDDDWIEHGGVIPALCNRLGSSKPEYRLIIIHLLRNLASDNARNKEKMADVGFLSTLVKSLIREEEERREAVGLLLNLSELSAVRRQIGRIQGCIVMLVALLNGDDPIASCDAGKLLNLLSSNTQNALHMAEAGYFKPLVWYLKEGSDMSKILMATALSRIELTDQSRASLGEDGAIEPLVRMFSTGKLEAKLSALNALQNLSSLAENVQHLIRLSILSPLLQLLFSVTSVLMTLREPASAILARIAESESILVNQDVAQQMLSLLNLSSPVIQIHLLQALNSIVSHPSASKVRRKMKENRAMQLLLPFLTETNLKIRSSALNLLHTLSKDLSQELSEHLGEAYINVIINIISSSSSERDKAAALGILSNFPINDKKFTELLKRENLLPLIVSIMTSSPATKTLDTQHLEESVTGVLVRFTNPSDKKLQLYSAEHGVIPLLVKLLSSESSVAKCKAATSLAQLSQNSLSLRKSKTSSWFCAPPSASAYCEVHEGYCFVKSTLCLVKAGAVSPLLKTLEGKEREADEAVLSALATLLQDEILENGSNYIAKTLQVQAIVKVLESGNTKAQEKALWILERIFRNNEHKLQYGESAQVLLIDLAQQGDSRLKPAIAKVLAQLELLQDQSSYF
ncbi:U-box domain-containing protein 44-like [Humulus lupulus]|uniref:U-box domain-containing protein 44-like n=1 Tax=Humulus lupulus TaxID=3486 RepID=UPI002B404062|nr:U-box domain-containing protein 44-like [Humulus lupulus]